MKNSTVDHVIQSLIHAGIREVCVCPGSRNSPLIKALNATPFIVKHFWYEERSAGFFAVGRARATNTPVAIVTTSGTACGELLPAAMEAYYTGDPIVLVTADRPRRFRGTGAPQTAEQEKMFGIYTPFSQDIEYDEICRLVEWDKRTPAHLNVCLEDWQKYPTIPQFEDHVDAVRYATLPPPKNSDALDVFFSKSRNPLVLVSTLKPQDREAVVQFLLKLNAPIYCEAISGIREDPRIQHLQITACVDIWNLSKSSGYPIDGVLRLGGVPVVRFWRDLEDRVEQLAECSLNELTFSGLSWGKHIQCSLNTFLPSYQIKAPLKFGDFSQWRAVDQEYLHTLMRLMEEEPQSEVALFYALSKSIPLNSMIYIGNSLPIRQWDLAATYQPRGYEVLASRGLNGIDGQISTFLGQSTPKRENWGIFGDLTTLYDFPGPWILHQLPERAVRIVTINNHGGKIFDRILRDPSMQHIHDFEFEHFAKMWRLTYERVERIPSLEGLPNALFLEVCPNPQASKRYWENYDQLKQKLLV